MTTRGQRSHGEARSGVETYERANRRWERRRRLLRVACAKEAPGAVIERLAVLEWQSKRLVQQIKDRQFGNLDAGGQGDWIKGGRK